MTKEWAAKNVKLLYDSGTLRQTLEHSGEDMDKESIEWVIEAIEMRLKRYSKRGAYTKGAAGEGERCPHCGKPKHDFPRGTEQGYKNGKPYCREMTEAESKEALEGLMSLPGGHD